MAFVKGPGGYLSWQFIDVATVIHRDDLASSWSEVGLPAVAFGDGYAATGLKMGRDPQLTTWERTVEPGA